MVKIIKRELGTWRGRFVLVLSISLIASFLLIGMESKSSAKVSELDIRNIEFEIRNMVFGANNPTVYLRPGETVRFIIYNYDRGMRHNLIIEGTNVRTRTIKYGEKASVIFHVPETEKEMVYLCDLHALSMRGSLSVSKDVNLAALSTK